MKTKSLLLVEDEKELLARYEKYASAFFSPIFTASNSESAKFLLKEQKIDCVVSDNRLPDGTGISMIKEMGIVDKGIPIILMTGFADKDIAIESVNNHLFSFLEKPFSKEDFHAILKKCIVHIDLIQKKKQFTDLCQVSNHACNYLKVAFRISKREMEIISHALHTTNNQSIANRLFISPGTVKKHLYNIFEKMEISSKEELKEIVYKANCSF